MKKPKKKKSFYDRSLKELCKSIGENHVLLLFEPIGNWKRKADKKTRKKR